MKRALISGTVYFLLLFALGFILGTIRVLIVAPRLGELAATLVEIPVMLVAAYFACGWTMRRWQVSGAASIRWTMVFWFLILLLLFETLLGALLFDRTIAAQWAVLSTPAGLIGLTAQIFASLLPVFVGKDAGG